MITWTEKEYFRFLKKLIYAYIGIKKHKGYFFGIPSIEKELFTHLTSGLYYNVLLVNIDKIKALYFKYFPRKEEYIDINLLLNQLPNDNK